MRVVAQEVDRGGGLGHPLGLLPDPDGVHLAQGHVLPGEVARPLLLPAGDVVAPEGDEPVVQVVQAAGDLGELAVPGRHHRRLVAEDVRRQGQAAVEHEPDRRGRRRDEVLPDVGVVLGGHRVVAVDGDVAVVDRHRVPRAQRVISHTVKTAISRQTVAPT